MALTLGTRGKYGRHRPPRREMRRRRKNIFYMGVSRSKYYSTARGVYRVFNEAEHEFFYSATGEPLITDTPFDTNATLPHTPVDTYGNGTHRFAINKTNGIYDSGFRRVGPSGEPYARLDVSGGSEIGNPPQKPNSVTLTKKADGVIRIVAVYFRVGDLRADEWAVAWKSDGTDPAVDTPDYTQAMTSGGMQVLDYDLNLGSLTITVKIRVQTRRNDGSWIYSETDDSDILTIVTDKTGPTAPPAGDQWRGLIE